MLLAGLQQTLLRLFEVQTPVYYLCSPFSSLLLLSSPPLCRLFTRVFSLMRFTCASSRRCELVFTVFGRVGFGRRLFLKKATSVILRVGKAAKRHYHSHHGEWHANPAQTGRCDEDGRPAAALSSGSLLAVSANTIILPSVNNGENLITLV